MRTETMAKVLKFIRLLKVEPYLFLVMCSFLIKYSTFQQFVQDKICLVNLAKEPDICYDITSSADPGDVAIVDTILSEANLYNGYLAVLRTVPGIVFTILVGPWTDKVKGARRTLMIVAAVGQALDAVMGLLNVYYERTWPTPLVMLISLPSSLLGGMATVQSAVMGYASLTTPARLLSVRFVVLDIILNVAAPLTTFLGGQLLSLESLIPQTIRNFTVVYIICLFTSIFAVLWVIFVIDDSDAVKNEENRSEDNDSQNSLPCGQTHRILDIENFKIMLRTCIRKRPNKGHIELWFLLIGNGICMLSVVGTASVVFSFAQKVYHWNVTEFSNSSSLVSLFLLLGMGLGVPFLVRVLKVTDPVLTIVGIASITVCFTTLGTFYKPYIFYVAFGLGALGGGSMVGIKAIISKLVDTTETGSIFAILAICQSTLNMVATYLYTLIFNATIDTAPGTVFQFAGAINLIPLLCIVWLDLYRIRNKSVQVRKETIVIQITKM